MKYPRDRNIHRPRHISLPNTYCFVSARTYYALPFLKEREAKEVLKQSMDKAVEKFNLLPVAWVILNNHYHWMFKSPDNSINAVSSNRTDRLQPVNNTLKGVSSVGGQGVSSVGGQSVSSNVVSRTDKLQFVTNNSINAVSADKSFNIGKVIGYLHGRSSNLINKFRHQESQKYPYDFTPQEFGILKARFASKLGLEYEKLDVMRAKKFEKLLEEQDLEGLRKFVKEVSRIWYQYTDHIIRDKADFYRHINYTYQNSVKHGYVEDMLDYEFSSIHDAIQRRGKKFILECFAKYPVRDFNPSFDDW